MRNLFFSVILAGFFVQTISAQDMSYSKPGKSYYAELPNPAKTPAGEWAGVTDNINVSFASDNIKYPKERVPEAASGTWNVKAWKGEKVHTQVLIWSKIRIPEVSFRSGDLKNEKGGSISSKNIKPAFVRYVITDEFGRGCDRRKPSDYDSSLVEDPIDIIKVISVEPNTVQPVWLSIEVPGEAKPGIYRGKITVNAGGKHDLNISLEVLDHLLPGPDQWKFDFDLWQSANSIAKVHDVELWSDEHFRIMKPYFKMLAAAGQKTITANIIRYPWGKTHIYYEDPSMIKWIKGKDGKWSFDYTIFDRYISFMMDCGINKHINCYTMVTWDLSFIYFDEATGKETAMQAKPGSPEYTEYWSRMITDFTRHLKSKGWFEKTAIAMDERPMESMKAVIDLLKNIDPEWKIALAGGYHPEIQKDIYDYCVYIRHKFTPEELAYRKSKGMPTTFYTACDDEHPNGHSFSPPAENAWICWYASARGFSGYLRWAYNNWAKAPLLDTRFRTWPGGENYQIYPGPRSSIRFEKFIEGIQDFEKIRILKEKFLSEGNSEAIKQIDNILSVFEVEKLKSTSASGMLVRAKESLNKF